MKDHDAFIDGLLSRLEAEWKERGDADLDALLPEDGHPQRRLTLITLIPVDQEYRWRSDDKKQVEAYLEGWPELCEDDEAIAELVEAECVMRADLGDVPSADEIHTRFPKLIGLIDLGKLAVPQKPTRDQVVPPQAPAGKNDPAETDPFKTSLIEKVGENIGHYHLLTVLGEGGLPRCIVAMLPTVCDIRQMELCCLPLPVTERSVSGMHNFMSSKQYSLATSSMCGELFSLQMESMWFPVVVLACGMANSFHVLTPRSDCGRCPKKCCPVSMKSREAVRCPRISRISCC